jgi:hypothetical protein
MSMRQYDPEMHIEAARTQRRWVTLFLTVLVMGGLYAIYLFVRSYYGDDGVRVAGIVVGLFLVIGIIIGLGVGVMFIATAMTQRHHDNVLTGLVRFQAADDRGEVARTVAGGVAGVLKSGNQLDRTMLTMANRMAQGQLSAYQQAQRGQIAQQSAETQRSWYDVPADLDDAVPPGWGGPDDNTRRSQ